MEELVSHSEEEERLKDAEASLGWSVAAEALDRVEREEMREFLMSALDQVPEAQRIVFVLKDLEDWDTEAIARHLDIPPALARQRLHRARMFLQGRLGTCLRGERP